MCTDIMHASWLYELLIIYMFTYFFCVCPGLRRRGWFSFVSMTTESQSLFPYIFPERCLCMPVPPGELVCSLGTVQHLGSHRISRSVVEGQKDFSRGS